MSNETAVKRIRELCGGRAADRFEPWVRVAGSWPGARPLLKRMAQAGGRNQVLDCLCEVRYGLVFAHLGFELTVEPSGRRGPDFSVSRDGVSAMVEISRFASVSPGPPVWEDDGLLVQYGNPQRDVNKALAKIKGKYPQLTGALSILGLWNDDDDLEDLEIDVAVQALIDDPERPTSLQFVLYGSPWFRTASLLCFPLTAVSKAVHPWIEDLRAVDVGSAWAV